MPTPEPEPEPQAGTPLAPVLLGQALFLVGASAVALAVGLVAVDAPATTVALVAATLGVPVGGWIRRATAPRWDTLPTTSMTPGRPARTTFVRSLLVTAAAVAAVVVLIVVVDRRVGLGYPMTTVIPLLILGPTNLILHRDVLAAQRRTGRVVCLRRGLPFADRVMNAPHERYVLAAAATDDAHDTTSDGAQGQHHG